MERDFSLGAIRGAQVRSRSDSFSRREVVSSSVTGDGRLKFRGDFGKVADLTLGYPLFRDHFWRTLFTVVSKVILRRLRKLSPSFSSMASASLRCGYPRSPVSLGGDILWERRLGGLGLSLPTTKFSYERVLPSFKEGKAPTLPSLQRGRFLRPSMNLTAQSQPGDVGGSAEDSFQGEIFTPDRSLWRLRPGAICEMRELILPIGLFQHPVGKNLAAQKRPESPTSVDGRPCSIPSR